MALEMSFLLEGIVHDRSASITIHGERMVKNCYEWLQSKACCPVLIIPIKDRKSTIMLNDGDGTYCFVKKASCDYEIEKQSPFLKKFLLQSQ